MFKYTRGAVQTPRRSDSIDKIDQKLFTADGWFALDAGNRRVAGVVVHSLEAGLALIGQGAVTTIVGRLRAPFVCVDVDLAGVEGEAVTEQVAGWAEKSGLWVLTRPSGGAPGRAHVIIACPAGRRAELEQLLADLRGSFRCAASRIDLRTAIRPLSAPHRTGVQTRPYGNLKDLARTLPKPTTKGPAKTANKGLSKTPLAPRPRRRQELPEPWQEYLTTGSVPPIGGTDRSRSTVEAIATGHMMRAGWSAGEAWQAIVTCHRDAMTKARRNKARWVQWVWNRAVRDDPGPAGPPEEIQGVVAAARERLHQLQWSLPVRQRPAVTAVGHAILDRVWRTGALRVPVAQRDLVLDTGIRNRATISAALKILSGPDGLGVLHTDPYKPTNKESSSFEFEVVAAAGVWEIYPPGVHTPSPREERSPLTPATWHPLPRAARAVWHTLQHSPSLTTEELGQQAGLTTTRTAPVSPSQRRTVRKLLTSMARAGLVVCDAQGRWTVRTPDHDAVDTASYDETAVVIAEERRIWRTGGSVWHRQRQAAIAADHERYRRWWAGLDPAERQRRTTHYERRFAAASVVDRCTLTTRLARSRRLAGSTISESERHSRWCAALGPNEYTERSIERAAWYDRLPDPLQRAYVDAWATHRATWDVPRGYLFDAESRAAAA